jgi:hypothetical protein
VLLADHWVELHPGAVETEACGDLNCFVLWRADPGRRVTSEAELELGQYRMTGRGCPGRGLGGRGYFSW